MFLIGWIVGFILGLIPFFVKKQKVHKINENLILEEQRLQSKIANQKSIFLANQQFYDVELAKQKEALEEYKKVCTERKQSIEQNLDEQLLQLGQAFQSEEAAAKEEYLKVIQSYQNDAKEKMNALDKEIQDKTSLLDTLKHKVDAATEVAKREEEKRTAVDFYRLQLSAIDVEEVKKLREIVSTLRDQDAINKVIWKVYYEKPTTDLIGRVIGSKVKTGIYKITNIQNQMTYVGQSVNIAERWKQHIKRGLGAETPTRNKLYPAMAATGLENFIFELIEECDKSLLDEREKYWQNYFNSLTYGYSMR